MLEKTTIQVSVRTKFQLVQVKGELLKLDGLNRTFDDVLQDLIYYWTYGKRRNSAMQHRIIR